MIYRAYLWPELVQLKVYGMFIYLPDFRILTNIRYKLVYYFRSSELKVASLALIISVNVVEIFFLLFVYISNVFLINYLKYNRYEYSHCSLRKLANNKPWWIFRRQLIICHSAPVKHRNKAVFSWMWNTTSANTKHHLSFIV